MVSELSMWKHSKGTLLLFLTRSWNKIYRSNIWISDRDGYRWFQTGREALWFSKLQFSGRPSWQPFLMRKTWMTLFLMSQKSQLQMLVGLPTRGSKVRLEELFYDSIKEELMPNITSLNTAKECYDMLVNLYEKKAPNQKRVLKKRLRTLKLNKDESVGSFFTKIK